MAYDIGPRIGIDGEREYRQQIQNINQQMKTLDSQLQLTASEFGKEASAQDKAKAKTETLTKQIELQEQKLKAQTEQMRKSAEKTGDNSTETQKYKEIVNKTAAELNKMKDELAQSTDKTKKLADSMKSAGDKMSTVGDKISSVGSSMSKYVTAPILAAGVASFKMASDLQENMNKTEVAFGDAADGVVKWSENTIEKFGLAQSTALEMASQFGDMATSMGFTTDEAAGMSESLVGLAADLSSFKNISTDQSMTALNAIFTGETESLKRLGVVMTEANLQAYAMSKGLSKSYKEMSQAEKVSLRYNYVLEMTKNAQGDFERTSDGAANQMRIMRERVKELGAQFGEKLLPVGEKILSFVNDLLDRFANLDDGTQNTIIQVGLFAAALGPVISTVGKTTSGIGNLTKSIGNLVEKASSGEGAIGKLGKGLGGLMSSTSLLSEVAVIGGPAIVAFGAALASINDAVWNADQPVWDLANAFANSMPNIEEYENYINGATSALTNFSIESTEAGAHIGEYDEKINSSIESIHTIMETAGAESRQFTEQEWQEIQELLGAVEEYTQKKVEAYQQQQAVVASMAELEVNMTKERSAELIKAAEDTKNQTVAIANQMYQQQLAEAETMFTTNKITKKQYEDMRNDAAETYNGMVADANKSFSETNGIVAQKFLEQNVLTDKNVKRWDEYYSIMESKQSDYDEAISRIHDRAREEGWDHAQEMAAISAAMQEIDYNRSQLQQEMFKNGADYLDESTQDIVSYYLAMAANTELYGGQVTEKEKEFVEQYVRIVEDLPEDMRDVARDSLSGFETEMNNRAPSLLEQAKGIAGGLINTWRSAFDMHSPSKVMAKIALNVWKGFENETAKQAPVMKNQASDVVKGIIDGINKSADNAGKSANELGELYIRATKEKLSDLEALHKSTEVMEVQYWEQVLKATKKGTRAYTDALIELTKAKDQLTGDVTKLSGDYAKNVANVNEQLKKDLNQVNKDLKANIKTTKDTLAQGIKDLRQAYNDAVSSRAESIKSSMGIFDAPQRAEKISKQTLINNLHDQVAALQEWDSVLDKLRGRIKNQDLLAELEAQGVDQIDTLREIAKMSNSELSQYEKLYSQKNRAAQERAKTENEALLKQTNAEIAKLKQDAAAQIAQAEKDAETQRQKLQKQAEKDIAALTTQYIKDLKALGVTGTTAGKDVGKNIANGIKSGFKTAMSGVTASTKTELDNLLTTIRKKLKINSPSKVFAGIGEYMAEGLGVGFIGEMKTVRRDISDAMSINQSFSRSFAAARTAQFTSPAARTAASGSDSILAIKQALYGVKIVLDDEVAGRFVEKTVTDIVYS